MPKSLESVVVQLLRSPSDGLRGRQERSNKYEKAGFAGATGSNTGRDM